MQNREYFNRLKKNKADFTNLKEEIRKSAQLNQLPKYILNVMASKESLVAFLQGQSTLAEEIRIDILVTQITTLNAVEAATLLLSNKRYLKKLEANAQEFQRLISHFKNNLQWLQALRGKFSEKTLRKHLAGHVDSDVIIAAVSKLKGKVSAGADSDNSIIQTLFDTSNPFHQENLAYYIKNPEKCSNCLKQRQVTDMFVIASASQIVSLCLALAKNRIDLLKQHFVQVARYDDTKKIQQALAQNSNAITTEFLCYKPNALTRELFCNAPNAVDLGTFIYYLMNTHHPRYLLKAHSDLTLGYPLVGQVKALNTVDGINHLLINNNDFIKLSSAIHYLVKFKYRLFKSALNNPATRAAVMTTLKANPNRNEWVIMHLRENPELVKILCAGDGNSKNFLDLLKMTDDPAKFVRKLAGQVNSKDRAKIIFQSVIWVARYTEQHPEYQQKFEKLLKEKFWCNGGYRSVRKIAFNFMSRELYQHKSYPVGTKTTRSPAKAQWLTPENHPEDDLRFILQNQNTRNLFELTKQQLQQLAAQHLTTQASHNVLSQRYFEEMDIDSLGSEQARVITQKSIYYILQNVLFSDPEQKKLSPEQLQKRRQKVLNEAIYGIPEDKQSEATKKFIQQAPANFFDNPLTALKDLDQQDIQAFIEYFKKQLSKLNLAGIDEIQKRFHGQVGTHNFDLIIAEQLQRLRGERIKNAAKLSIKDAAELFYEYAKDIEKKVLLTPYFLYMIKNKDNEKKLEAEIRRRVFYGAILKADWAYISANKEQFIQDLQTDENNKEHFSVFDAVLPADITDHVHDWSLTELFELRNYKSIMSVLISRFIEDKPLDKKSQEVFLNLLMMPEFRSKVKLGQQLSLLTLIEAARKDPALQVKILTETIQRFRNEPLGEAWQAFLSWYQADNQVQQYLLPALPDIIFNNRDNEKFTRILLSSLSDRKRDVVLRDKRCDHQFKTTYPEVANFKAKVSQSNIPTHKSSPESKGANTATDQQSLSIDPIPVLVTETTTSETTAKLKKGSSSDKKLKKEKKEKKVKKDKVVVTTKADKLEEYKDAEQQSVQTQLRSAVKQEANNSADNNVDPTEFHNIEEIYQFIYENRNNQIRCITALIEINKINPSLIAAAFRPMGTIDYTLGLLLENLESKLSFSITETKVTTQPKSPPPARKHKEKVHKPEDQEKDYEKAKKIRSKKSKKSQAIQFSQENSKVVRSVKDIDSIFSDLAKTVEKHDKDEFNHTFKKDNKSVWLAYEAVKLQYEFLENLRTNGAIDISNGKKDVLTKSQHLNELANKYELNNRYKQEQALRQISGVADQYAKAGFRILAAHYYQDIIATCSEDDLDIGIRYDASIALMKLLMEDSSLFPNADQIVGELFKSFFDNKIYPTDFIKNKIKHFPLDWLISHAIVECISDNLDDEDPNAEMAEYISHLKPAGQNPDNALANENLDELKKKLELKEFVMQFNDNQGNAPALAQLLTRIFKRDPKLLFNENLAFDFTEVIATVDSDINILLFYLRNKGLSESWLADKNTMQQLYDLAKQNQLIRFTLETCYTHWSEAIAKDAFAQVVMVGGADQNQNNDPSTVIVGTPHVSSVPLPPTPPDMPIPPPLPMFTPLEVQTNNGGLAGILSGGVKLKKTTDGSIDAKLAADKEKNADKPSDSKSGSDAQNAVFKSIQDINEVKLKAAWQALFFADKDAISPLGHALLKCLNVQQEADISPAVKRGLSDVYNSIFKVKDEVSGDEVLKNLLANANLKTLPKEIRSQFKDIAGPIAELAKAKKLEPVKKPPAAPRANPIVVKNSGIKADYQIKESLKEKDGINLTAFLGHVDQVVKITDPLVKMYEQLIRIKEKKDPTTMEEFKKELCKLLEAYMTDASKQLVKDAHEKGEGAASLEQTIATRAGLVITKMEVLYSLYAISHEKASRSSFLDAIASRKPKSQESSKSPATEINSPIYNLCMDQEKVFDKTEIRKIMVKQNEVAIQNIEREIAQAIDKLNKGNRINREILLGKIQGIVNGNRKHVAEIFEEAIWKRLQAYAKHIKKENCLIEQLEQSILATVPRIEDIYNKDHIFDKKSIADNVPAISIPDVEAVLVDIVYFIRSNKPVFCAEFFKILESVIDSSRFDTVIWNAVKAYAEKLGRSHLVQDRDPLKERLNGPKLFDKSKKTAVDPTPVVTTSITDQSQSKTRPVPSSNNTPLV